MGRHPVRDVLLLPAMQHGPGEDLAHVAGTQQHASGAHHASGEQTPVRFSDAPSLGVIVRRARLTDALALSRYPNRQEMNHPGSSRSDSDPARAIIRGALPFTHNRQPVFVASAEEDRRILGFAQFRAAGPDQRWLAESIGANAGVYDPEPVVSELLRHVIKSAGLDGVKRLYAKVNPDSPLKVSLRQNGFSAYARERVMASNTVPVMASTQGARVQEQADVWAIHQLYLQSTPREVQYAEALTSHSWDVDVMLRSSGYGCHGWLVADDYFAVGYVRAMTRRDAHIVDFMVSAEHRDVFPILMSAVFHELSRMQSRRVYVVVRDYQSEYIPFLYELGFGIELAQEAHIRYTTVSMRSAVIAPNLMAIDPKAEVPARRVPTFFGGTMDSFDTPEGQMPMEDWPVTSLGALDKGE